VHACFDGARDDVVAITVESLKVKVAMCINQHWQNTDLRVTVRPSAVPPDYPVAR
jgi:hypothetical protein